MTWLAEATLAVRLVGAVSDGSSEEGILLLAVLE